MRLINKDEYQLIKDEIKDLVKKGQVFVYPTDTIYGLGTDATCTNCIKKLKAIKERHTNPFSIIAPSKEWIIENCEVDEKAKEWIDKLPGPYTLILKLKNKDAISPECNDGLDTVGVRIPDHWFTEMAALAGVPITTTSANKAGGDFMTSLENLDPDIKAKVDFVVYEGEKQGKPSTLVKLDNTEVSLKEREK